MSELPLVLKMQGLWVGTALGELYTTGAFSTPLPSDPLTVQTTLPKTYRLCLNAALGLKGKSNWSAEVLTVPRWQDAFLNLLPLTFVYPQGGQALKRALAIQVQTSDALSPKQQEQGIGALALIELLEWLHADRTTRPGTHLERHLDNVTAQLQDRRSLNPPMEKTHTLSGWTPDAALTQMLYLLLSSPDDFRLTVQRASFMGHSQPDLVILLAALSGFCNGFSHLPLDWRRVLNSVVWSVGKPLEDSLLTLATLCVAQWSGCYRPPVPSDWGTETAIALPGQLRPR